MSKPESKARVSRKAKRSKAKSSPVKMKASKSNLRTPFAAKVNNFSQQIPVAYDVDIAHIVQQRKLTHGKKSGTCLYGQCPVASVGYDNTVPNTLLFYPYNSAYVTPGHNAFYLNPTELFPTDSLEDRESNNYTRFKFIKLNMIYIGNSSTSASTWFYMGYYPDGAIASGDINTNFMRASAGSTKCVVWTPIKSIDVSSLLPDDLYFCDADAGGGDSGFRQSYQGAMTGIWVQVPGGTSTVGELWIDYEVELWDPRISSNLALSSKGSKKSKIRGLPRPRSVLDQKDFRVHFDPQIAKDSQSLEQKSISRQSSSSDPLRDPPLSDEKEEPSTLVSEPDPISGLIKVYRKIGDKMELVEVRPMDVSARRRLLEQALTLC